MSVYYCVLIYLLVCICAFNTRTLSRDVKSLLFFSSGFVLLMVAGLRYQVGTDYAAYQSNYTDYLNADISLLGQPVLTAVAKLSAFIYNDYATWFFLMSFITLVPILITIKNRSINIGFSLLLFVLLGSWHTSFNIVKQSAAMAIIFAGYPFLIDRKFFKWLLICFLATMIHVSALFMIPIYFVATPKVSYIRVIVFILIGVVILMVYDQLFLIMESLKSDSGGAISSESDLATTEVNSLRILVSLAPFIFFLLKKYDFKNEEFCVLFNLSLINAVLNIASSQSIYLNRIVIYTNVYNLMFYPYLVRPFGKNGRMLMYATIFVLYLVYWSYDLYKCSDTVNYQWIFNR